MVPWLSLWGECSWVSGLRPARLGLLVSMCGRSHTGDACLTPQSPSVQSSSPPMDTLQAVTRPSCSQGRT